MNIKAWLEWPDPAHASITIDNQTLDGIEEVVDYLATNQWPAELKEQSTRTAFVALLSKEIKHLPDNTVNKITDFFIHELAPHTGWSFMNQPLQSSLREAFISALCQNQVEDAKKLLKHMDENSLREILNANNTVGLAPLEEAILMANDDTCRYIYDELSKVTPPGMFPEVKEKLVETAPQRWVNAAVDEPRQEALDKINTCRCEDLEQLNLGWLELSSLPGFLLLNLPYVKEVDLSSNNLTSFTVPREGLTHLRVLRLDFNKLTSFTLLQESLTYLETLDLGCNQLPSFTVPQGSLTKLIKLDLRENQLNSFTAPQGSLTNLKNLYLHINKLKSLPFPQGSFIHLEDLDLSDNPLSELPQELGQCIFLQTLGSPESLKQNAEQILMNVATNREPLFKNHLIPKSFLERYDQSKSAKENFCHFLLERNGALLQNLVIENLKSFEEQREHLFLLVDFLYSLIKDNILDVDSPLGQQIIHYKILLSSSDKKSPWNIYHLHKERLNEKGNLPLPVVKGGYFDYTKMGSLSVTPDMLPQGKNFALLEKLIEDFRNRFASLDDQRKRLIIEYLNATMDKPISKIDDLLINSQDPWWATHLNAPACQKVSESTWKLINALAYIDDLDGKWSEELPDSYSSGELNFVRQENLLSPKERALLKLLGQVQNCTTGKEAGLNNFLKFIPDVKFVGGTGQERISDGIRTYLNDYIINTNAFLRKLNVSENEPLHQSKFIRNRLCKELHFPLEFDLNSGILSQEILDKSPGELLTALFAEVEIPKLYEVIAESLNRVNWESEEGIELYESLKKRAPEDKLKACCLWDEDDFFKGMRVEAVPYLLKEYAFFIS